MPYFFTEEGFSALDREINLVRERVKKAAKEVGLSCQQSSETFHDNFGYEQGERDHRMWSHQLQQLIQIRKYAKLVFSNPYERKVGIGRTVKVRDLDSSEDRVFKVGSYIILGDSGTNAIPIFSYDAPLPKALIGAGEGDYREAFFGDKWHRLLILKIE